MTHLPVPPAGFLPSLAAALLWVLVMQPARASIWGIALITLPGTVAHEFSHLLVGFLLMAKPVGFSVWPKRSGRDWMLGSVSFRRINLFNGGAVTLAPLLFLPLVWYGLVKLAAPLWVHHQWGWWLGAAYLISTILYAAIPSAQDIKLGGPSLVFYGTVGGLWWLFGASVWRTLFH
jgi:hypothetical protein